MNIPTNELLGRFLSFLPLALFLLSATCSGAEPDVANLGSEVNISHQGDFTYLGAIRPRHAREIESSNWSVGAETMDRDYTIYANWRNYLGSLGVKKARIQSGWAKTEQKKGQYDWAWLDEIIPDMVDQGVRARS